MTDAIITLQMAGEAVTNLVNQNAERILATKTLGKQRQTDSRNILNETMFSRYQIVSMLAVAIDRLAVYQALTPTPSVAQGIRAANGVLAGCEHQLTNKQIRQLVEAVLDR